MNRIFEKIKQELKLESQHIDLLGAIAQITNRHTQLEPMLDAVLPALAEIVGASAAWVVLLDGDSFHLVATYDLPPALAADDKAMLRWSGCNCERLLLTHCLKSACNILECQRLQQAQGHTQGLRYHVSVPLRVNSREPGLGLLNLAMPERRTLTDSELRTLTAAADQIAVAIERAQLLQTLLERNQQLAAANERLQELDRLKSKFVADVSHELRTPVTNLKMNLYLIEQGVLPAYERYLNVLQQETGRLAALIEDILDISRLEDTRGAPSRHLMVDLNLLVEQVLTAHQSQAETAGLVVTFEPSPTLPTLRGDPQHLTRMVINLIVNAINYTPTGSISVRTFVEGEYACLEVKDTGVGIAEEDLRYIFDRFYRGVQIGQSAQPGTGLGLSIVKEIVERHRGRIEVESEVGKGSLFRIWLPIP